MKLDTYLTPYIKFSSKQTEDLNVKAETIKLLEENKSVHLCDLGLGNGSLDMISKAQGSNEKIGKQDIIKMKLLYFKDNQNVNKQPTHL